jgi:hypothetical protein
MQVPLSSFNQFSFPREMVKEYFCSQLPQDFCEKVTKDPEAVPEEEKLFEPTLYTAHLPLVLNWLHSLEMPRILEQPPCNTPLLLYDKDFSAERLLFHYGGSPRSAKLIRDFVALFRGIIKDSCATIISPSFIPKSKIKEEQELIQLVRNATSETSFIKFNFNRMGDFWSYAIKHQCTLLITTKSNQADLAKVLFHFYKQGVWCDRLSFYLAV